jgi:hypothetical protein
VVVGNDGVPPIGEVDEALGCVRLRWHKNEHNDPWRALVPMSSVRGKVRVVSALRIQVAGGGRDFRSAVRSAWHQAREHCQAIVQREIGAGVCEPSLSDGLWPNQEFRRLFAAHAARQAQGQHHAVVPCVEVIRV